MKNKNPFQLYVNNCDYFKSAYAKSKYKNQKILRVDIKGELLERLKVKATKEGFDNELHAFTRKIIKEALDNNGRKKRSSN